MSGPAVKELRHATIGGVVAAGDASTVALGAARMRGASPAGALAHRMRDHSIRALEAGLADGPPALPGPREVGAPDLAMRWRFTQETIEDRSNRSLHRVGCPELAHARALVRHPAGQVVARAKLPEECEKCRPAVEIMLGRVSSA